MVQRMNKKLYEAAYKNVLAVRGSDDVPAFDLCVQAEMKRLEAGDDR